MFNVIPLSATCPTGINLTQTNNFTVNSVECMFYSFDSLIASRCNCYFQTICNSACRQMNFTALTLSRLFKNNWTQRHRFGDRRVPFKHIEVLIAATARNTKKFTQLEHVLCEIGLYNLDLLLQGMSHCLIYWRWEIKLWNSNYDLPGKHKPLIIGYEMIPIIKWIYISEPPWVLEFKYITFCRIIY